MTPAGLTMNCGVALALVSVLLLLPSSGFREFEISAPAMFFFSASPIFRDFLKKPENQCWGLGRLCTCWSPDLVGTSGLLPRFHLCWWSRFSFTDSFRPERKWFRSVHDSQAPGGMPGPSCLEVNCLDLISAFYIWKGICFSPSWCSPLELRWSTAERFT